MQPKNDITIYRTKGDTDPIIFELKVNRNGVTSNVVNSAIVTLNLKVANVVSITGTSGGNGIFSFSMNTVNTSSIELSQFEVHVSDSYDYVIATGVVEYRDRLA